MHPFRYYVRARYQDCDSQHVVFNARYGDYIDLAITEFMQAVMPERNHFANTFEIQLKKQVVEWSAPARFQDVIEISAAVSRMGRTSFEVRFDLRLPAKGNETIVTADGVYVHVTDDKGRWKSTAIPDAEKARLVRGAPGVIVDHAGYYPIVVPKA